MPHQIRAAILTQAGRELQIGKVTLADPRRGEVRIRMLRASLCHSDLHAIDGHIDQIFPVVMGHEGCGEVAELGKDVRGLAVGDRVIPYLVPDCGTCAYCRSGRTNLCKRFVEGRLANDTRFSRDGQPIYAFQQLGTFAEQIVIPADMVVRIDAHADPEIASCIGCGVTTGFGAATITAGVLPDSSVLVVGCGGVGLSAMQGARMAGAATIIATDVNPAKEEIARKLGATHFILAERGTDLVEEVRQIVPLGVDYALECVGNLGLARQALDATNMAWGRAVCVGVLPKGTELSTAPINLMLGREWTGSLMGGAKRADVARFVALYQSGDLILDAMVTDRHPLADINRGFQLMREGKSIRSVVTFSED